MSDDNVIKFRKPPKPKPPQKPKRALRLPPFVIIILAALAIGAVTYVMDQGKATNLPPPQSGPSL